MPRVSTLATLALVLLAAPFALYSAGFGLRGFTADLSDETRLYTTPLPNAALFSHMLTGALITLVVPLQLIPAIRDRYPRFHRRLGYTLLAATTVTALAGLVYIALNGTIGGPNMSAGFAVYGLLMLWAAANTAYHALDKAILRHRAWALRLAVLAAGSFLFRLAYGMWFLATDGAGSTEALTGPFDRIMVWAFYLVPLGALELYLAKARARR